MKRQIEIEVREAISFNRKAELNFIFTPNSYPFFVLFQHSSRWENLFPQGNKSHSFPFSYNKGGCYLLNLLHQKNMPNQGICNALSLNVSSHRPYKGQVLLVHSMFLVWVVREHGTKWHHDMVTGREVEEEEIRAKQTNQYTDSFLVP